MHAHDLVPAWVNDFDGDASVFSNRKRERFCAAEFLKLVFVDDTFERASDFVPCRLIGKEGLRDAEGSTVVVGIDEPRRDLVCPCGIHCVIYGVVDVYTLHPTLLRREE